EDPAGAVLAQENREDQYRNGTATPDVNMAANSVQVTVNASGSGVAVQIRNPYLGIYHVIALQGVFPSRS
ncbi:MAG: phage tail protein, partial [Planctomycetota bacterium]